MSKSLQPIPLEEHPVLKAFGAFRRYYAGFFSRVAGETVGFFGWNRRTLLVPVLYVIGAIVGFATLEGEVVRDEIMTALAFGLIPVGGLAVLVTLVNVIRAPWLLDRERQAVNSLKFKTAQDRLEENTRLIEYQKSKLDNFDGEWPSLKQRINLLELQLAQAELDKSGLHGQLTKLAEQLLPRFELLFENKPPFVEETVQDEVVSRRIRFGLKNISLKTIESVIVSIDRLFAYGSIQFNLPLRLESDEGRSSPRRAFSLPPGFTEYVGLAEKGSDSADIFISHAFDGHRIIATNNDNFDITITIAGFNAVSLKKRFRLTVDSDGALQCEPLDSTDSTSP